MKSSTGATAGGVAAVDEHGGVVSPGGVGYDIDCGVRLMTTRLVVDELRARLRQIALELQRDIPAGVGATRRGHHDQGRAPRAGGGGQRMR